MHMWIIYRNVVVVIVTMVIVAMVIDMYIVAMVTITMVIIAMITHYHHLMVMVTMVIVPTCNEKVTIMSIKQPKWKDSSCNSKDINTTANRCINIYRDRQHHWDRVWIVTVGQVYPRTPAVQAVMYKIAIVSKILVLGKVIPQA